MTGFVGAIVALAFVSGIFVVMFRGTRGRVGRPPRGIGTRLSSPSDIRWVKAGLCGLAFGSLLGRLRPDDSTTVSIVTGLAIGFLIAAPMIGTWVTLAFDGLAVILSVIDAGAFIAGREGVASLSAAYRIAVMSLTLASFTLAIVLFQRSRVFHGGRGLALFGLVEIITFLAAPAGRDSVGLGGGQNGLFAVIALAAGFGIGFLASEYLLGVLAMGVAIVSWFEESVFGDARLGYPALIAGVVAALCALGFGRLARTFGRTGV